ncbi:hypothetical protein [Nonomuraea jiangxiensis]|uniref:Uncharacterized protein n=1 Tax=Nonomuraea jiangxiensis TaxID=633440 RepID=A0A1G9CF68_9ACTN|nr:hypothetical protein [Nonomuraea jiangxiensis]SDK50321.1 hypothetical protein SAMN05421869_116156 [Nonomuraea jiangxiensis]
MPGVETMDELSRAVGEFRTDGYVLPVEATALDRARRSLEKAGLLLLGEIRGVRENPLVIQWLMRELGLTNLALEWPHDLRPHLDRYLADGSGLDHPLWWLGDGRVTAGHLAVLRAFTGVSVTLFDGWTFTADWSERDAAMARRVLAAGAEPALVVAGNAHTPTVPTDLGVPMGAWLARARPALESIRIDYGSGGFYNIEPRRFAGHSAAAGLREGEEDGLLVVGLPECGEATVPHLPPDRLREHPDW